MVSTPSLGSPIMSLGYPATDVIAMMDKDFQMRISDTDLVRRHSVSLRSPPAGSIASEILLSSQKGSNAVAPSLVRIRSLLADTKDLSEQLSDFGSCRESFGSGSSSSDEENTIEYEEPFKTSDPSRGFKRRKLLSRPSCLVNKH